MMLNANIVAIILFNYLTPRILEENLSKRFINEDNSIKISINIERYGARANDPNFDNGPAIVKALLLNQRVLIPPHKTFAIYSSISISGLRDRTLIATGATIVNHNYDVRTCLFDDCTNIRLIGGFYTRDRIPIKQNGKDQSTIGFKNCKNVLVKGLHIKYSPEMGIDNNVVINGVYSYNIIEHCLRDGIYAHYSANLKYLNNFLDQIKDDALSIHDYGQDSQRSMLHQAMYDKGGYSLIAFNKISNCIQGISTIGCKNLLIKANEILTTLHAGINVINSEDLYPNSDARCKNIKILNNYLNKTGGTTSINSVPYKNLGQLSSGRAAIFVACDRHGSEFFKSHMRSSNIEILNNKVTNSAVNGATLFNVDGLILKKNVFRNCHSDVENAPEYTGNIVEVIDCSKIDVSDNRVVDSRKVVLHKNAYHIQNASGIFLKGVVKGYKSKAVDYSANQF